MIITKEEMGISYLMKATQGEWEFTQMYSKNIPLDRIESHFNIEATESDAKISEKSVFIIPR